MVGLLFILPPPVHMGILLLLLRSSLSRHYSKILYRRKRKDRKSQKSRSEMKVVGFSSASLFPARKQEAVTQDGTGRITT